MPDLLRTENFPVESSKVNFSFFGLAFLTFELNLNEQDTIKKMYQLTMRIMSLKLNQ